MLLERRQAAQRPFVIKGRHTPLDRFHNFRARSVNEFAQVSQNGLGEIGGLRDVSINPRIFLGHAWMVDSKVQQRQGNRSPRLLHGPG